MATKYATTVGQSNSKYWLYRVGYKQSKPYKAPLPYELIVHKQRGCIGLYNSESPRKIGYFDTANAGSVCTYAQAWCKDPPITSSLRNDRNIAYNRALNKVADRLSYVQNLFEAWYERKEAYSLLGQTGKQLLGFALNWNKPKYWRKFIKGSKSKIKDPSSLPEAWLLANFAIKPLIGTVDSCMNLLLSDFPIHWVEGSSGIEHGSAPYWGTPSDMSLFFKGSHVVKIGVEVKAYNPNAQLSNIMGLTTPFSTAMSVVPWGWALNYFVNINEVLSNFEVRFPGVVIGNSYVTTMTKCFGVGSVKSQYLPELVNGYFVPTNKPWCLLDSDTVYMTRTTGNGVPKYKLVRTFPSLGSSQFANLFSALALTMKGKAK